MEHDEELGGAVVAPIVVRPVADAALLLGLAAGDDVQDEPSPAEAPEGGGLLCSEGRGEDGLEAELVGSLGDQGEVDDIRRPTPDSGANPTISRLSPAVGRRQWTCRLIGGAL